MLEAYTGGAQHPRAAVGRCPRGIAVAASTLHRPYLAAVSRAPRVLLFVFFLPPKKIINILSAMLGVWRR